MPSSKKERKAQERHELMKKERTFLTNFFDACLQGNFEAIKTCIETYILQEQQANNDNNNDDLLNQILTSTQDGNQRKCLHFICQSSPNKNAFTLIQNLSSWLETKTTNVNSIWKTLIRQKDVEGMTPLMVAMRDSSTSNKIKLNLVQWILSLYPKAAMARSKLGVTPLHYLSTAPMDNDNNNSTKELFRMLYEVAPTALETSSQRGGTPLHWAAATPYNNNNKQTNSSLIVLQTLLMDLSMDEQNKTKLLFMPNEQGCIPLVLSMACGNDQASQFLLLQMLQTKNKKWNPLVDALLPGNVTALHMAADCNLIQTLTTLMQHGIRQQKEEESSSSNNPPSFIQSCRNAKGETPLDLACVERHVGCVMLLLNTNSEQVARDYIAQRKQQPATKSSSSSSPKKEKDDSTDNKKNTNGDDDLGDLDPLEQTAMQQAKDIFNKKSTITQKEKDEALEAKQLGNQAYGKGLYEQANKHYSDAISLWPSHYIFYSNRSVCCLQWARKQQKQEDNDDGEQLKNVKERALQDAVICFTLYQMEHEEEIWPKACFRWSQARLLLYHRCQDAALLAWKGLKCEPNNAELKQLLQTSVQQGREQHEAALLQKKEKEKEAGKDSKTS